MTSISDDDKQVTISQVTLVKLLLLVWFSTTARQLTELNHLKGRLIVGIVAMFIGKTKTL